MLPCGTFGTLLWNLAGTRGLPDVVTFGTPIRAIVTPTVSPACIHKFTDHRGCNGNGNSNGNSSIQRPASSVERPGVAALFKNKGLCGCADGIDGGGQDGSG